MTGEFYTQDCLKENKKYIVKKVFDGDTILLSNNKKVRLLGIDAFEHDQNIYGLNGKDFLTMLLLNRNVCIETDIQKNDIYGRTLGYVFIAMSETTKQSQANLRKLSGIATPRSARLAMTFINEEILKNGYGILYDFPPNIKYIDKLKKAQIYARENMLGIWEKESYIRETPSQWRHKNRK